MVNPRYPAAVVAGNVETSQVITDALYGALGVLAASQGTMNNFTFGNDEHQYYETICGGAGAGADFDGCDAIQTHMTNSRLTDPEVLEWRFPVRLEAFRIRVGTGGAGLHHGGNGVERRLRFLSVQQFFRAGVNWTRCSINALPDEQAADRTEGGHRRAADNPGGPRRARPHRRWPVPSAIPAPHDAVLTQALIRPAIPRNCPRRRA